MSGTTIKRIAVIGTGVIGASWATYFHGRGFDVVASDPGPDVESNLRRMIAAQWPAMECPGLAPGASIERLRFTACAEAAVGDAQFVQENGPERVDLKREFFSQLDAAARPYWHSCRSKPERTACLRPAGG